MALLSFLGLSDVDLRSVRKVFRAHRRAVYLRVVVLLLDIRLDGFSNGLALRYVLRQTGLVASRERRCGVAATSSASRYDGGNRAGMEKCRATGFRASATEQGGCRSVTNRRRTRDAVNTGPTWRTITLMRVRGTVDSHRE